MDMIQLGPLNLKVDHLILLLSGIGTFVVLKILLRNSQFYKEYSDVLFNMALMWVLFYKFSVVLFRPMLIFENPLGLLYFNGGLKGIIGATFFSVAYILWKYKKLSWPRVQFTHAIIYTSVTFLLLAWIIRTIFAFF